MLAATSPSLARALDGVVRTYTHALLGAAPRIAGASSLECCRSLNFFFHFSATGGALHDVAFELSEHLPACVKRTPDFQYARG